MMLTNIENLREYLSRGQLYSNDILSLMTVLRIQLEKDNSKNNYRWLNLFCNWCVHSKLSQSAIAIEIFQTFYKALGKYDLTKGNSFHDFYDYMFDKFRDEIRQLFIKHSIVTGLLDNERVFCEFLIMILLIIKDRPIYLPQRLNKSQQEEVDTLHGLLKFAKNRKDIDLTPISLFVEHTKEGTFNCVLTTAGQGEGKRIIFNLSTICYKNKRFSVN